MASTKKKPGTAMANWDEELARQAEESAAMEANAGNGGQQFFSFKGGILSFDKAPIPGNQMVAIVLDSILENIWHEAEYDPDNPAPPTCFAHGRDEKTLEPHADVVERDQQQNEVCEGCPKNLWGSAEKGRGKACKNRRRVSVIPAGTINQRSGEYELIEDEEHYRTIKEAYMNLPVMSVQGYAAWVKGLKSALKRPPHGVVALIKLIPDAKSQFLVTFETLQNVPNELMAVIMERHAAAKEAITFSHNLDAREEVAPPANRGRQAVGRNAPKAAARTAVKAPAKPSTPVKAAAATKGPPRGKPVLPATTQVAGKRKY